MHPPIPSSDNNPIPDNPKPSVTPMRLNRWIAESGLCSRREADRRIEAGRVEVNGQPVASVGMQVNPAIDVVTVDGKPLPSHQKQYILFHKPVGVLTTRRDQRATGKSAANPHKTPADDRKPIRKTIYDLLPPELQHLDPAGRLDYNSSGALILSNDGDFIYRLTHPKFKCPKLYEVTFTPAVSAAHLPRLLKQLKDGVRLKPDHVLAQVQAVKSVAPQALSQATQEQLQPLKLSAGYSALHLTLTTGYNRQIRRTFEALGYRVRTLHRLAVGDTPLNSLSSGQYQSLHLTGASFIHPSSVR